MKQIILQLLVLLLVTNITHAELAGEKQLGKCLEFAIGYSQKNPGSEILIVAWATRYTNTAHAIVRTNRGMYLDNMHPRPVYARTPLQFCKEHGYDTVGAWVLATIDYDNRTADQQRILESWLKLSE